MRRAGRGRCARRRARRGGHRDPAAETLVAACPAPTSWMESLTNLSEREGQLDGDKDCDRLAEARARAEPPLFRSLDGFLVETERRVERSYDLDAADAAIRQDDALEEHRALDLGAHRVGGVLRLHFFRGLRQLHTIARPVRAAAGAASESGTKSRALT